MADFKFGGLSKEFYHFCFLLFVVDDRAINSRHLNSISSAVFSLVFISVVSACKNRWDS